MIEKNDWNPSSHLLKLIASACTSSWKGLNHWKLPVRYLLIKARVEIEETSKTKQKVSSFQFISTFLYLSLPSHCCVKEKGSNMVELSNKSLPGSPQWWGAPAKRRQSSLGSKPLRHLQASTILHLSNFTPFHSVSLPLNCRSQTSQMISTAESQIQWYSMIWEFGQETHGWEDVERRQGLEGHHTRSFQTGDLETSVISACVSKTICWLHIQKCS